MVEYHHEGEEFLYVIKGHVEARVGEDQSLLKKGETLHFDAGITHRLRNLSNEDAKLLVVIYTPSSHFGFRNAEFGLKLQCSV